MCPQTAPPAPPLALGGPAAAPAPPRPWGRVAPPAATPPGGPRALVDAIVAGGGKLFRWLPLLERAKRAMPLTHPVRPPQFLDGCRFSTTHKSCHQPLR